MTDSNSANPTRRRLLKAAGVTGLAGLAGCTGGGGGDGTENDSEADAGSDGTTGSDTEGSTTSSSDSGSGSGSEASVTFASSFQSGTLENIAIQRLKERVEEETGGRFTINHVPGGAYGGEVEMTQTLASGGVGGMGAGPIPIFLWANEYWYTSSPYVLEDYEQFVRIMESDTIQENVYQRLVEEQGVRAIGRPFYVGRRNVTANSAIRTPEDAQNMKIRIPGLDAWVTIWQGIGVNPTSIAGDEIYSALQTGTAAGAAVDANLALSTKLHEVQSHFNITQQMVGNRNLWMNENTFQGLDQSYRDLVLEAGREITVEVAELGQTEEEETISQLEENGMTVVDDVDVAAFREAATPAIERLFEEKWAGTWDDVKSM